MSATIFGIECRNEAKKRKKEKMAHVGEKVGQQKRRKGTIERKGKRYI